MLPNYAPNTAAPLARRESAIDALSDVLATERRLLEELVHVMQKQRTAVNADDLQSLDDSVFATYRVLATLGEARRRRKSVNRLVGGSDDMNVNDLEAVLGDRSTPAVIAARDALQAAASTLSREVEMNKQLLNTAMHNGNEYVQKLFGGAATAAIYDAGASRSGTTPVARLTPAMVPTAPRLLDRSI
jgi:flagellar biosynthesis/type III secretory pathway chaperone